MPRSSRPADKRRSPSTFPPPDDAQHFGSVDGTFYALPQAPHVVIYSPVPMAIQRVANVERAQMLVEAAARPALQAFLASWRPALHDIREKGMVRWAIDVDPLAI